MDKARQIEKIAQLTSEHPEVAVELLDHLGNIRIILFNGMSHPECLPTGGKRDFLDHHDDPVQAVERANVFPRELYEDAALIDFEPIAQGVSLDEAIRTIEAD